MAKGGGGREGKREGIKLKGKRRRRRRKKEKGGVGRGGEGEKREGSRGMRREQRYILPM